MQVSSRSSRDQGFERAWEGLWDGGSRPPSSPKQRRTCRVDLQAFWTWLPCSPPSAPLTMRGWAVCVLEDIVSLVGDELLRHQTPSYARLPEVVQVKRL